MPFFSAKDIDFKTCFDAPERVIAISKSSLWPNAM